MGVGTWEVLTMATCPICQWPGAYVGFSSVECRNPSCEHFVLVEEKLCPCCGKAFHEPNEDCDSARAADGSFAINIDGDPSMSPGGPGSPNYSDRDGYIFGTIGQIPPGPVTP